MPTTICSIGPPLLSPVCGKPPAAHIRACGQSGSGFPHGRHGRAIAAGRRSGPLGLVLIVAVHGRTLARPPARVSPRLWAWLRGAPPPVCPISAASRSPAPRRAAAVGAGARLGKRGLAAFLSRRDAAAVLLTIALWLFGLCARPDFWGGLDNSFALLLAFSEIALLAVGLTFVMANGDIDLSVGSVLALSGAMAAVMMKDTDLGPAARRSSPRSRPGSLRGAINGWLTAYVRLPAFIATLGTFYWARGIGSSIVAGHAAQRISRKLQSDRAQPLRAAEALGVAPDHGLALAGRQGGQRADPLHAAGRAHRGRRARQDAVRPEGLRDRRQRAGGELRRHQHRAAVRFTAMVFVGDLRRLRRRHLRRLLPQLHPDRRHLRELDAHLLGHHRRRLDLRRLRHDDRLARGRGGDHADPLAAVAADHAARRRLLRAAAAMAERVHRRDPHRRGGRRHLGAPEQHPRSLVRPRDSGARRRARRTETRHDTSDRRDARHRQELRPGPGAASTSICASLPARCSASSATIRRASRR